jgi:hypothetical protein
MRALTGLFYRSQISSEDELKASEREMVLSAALDQLSRPQSLCKQGRKYLQITVAAHGLYAAYSLGADVD